MGSARKLQTEIERTLKKVQEGIEEFDEIWDKVYDADNQNLKEKYEADLKKEIKKLQRYRDQIKTWISGSDIKDKTELVNARKAIEREMERFKVCEKETKTKAFSKEGLGLQAKLDPRDKARADMRDWLNQTTDTLMSQIEMFECEVEGLATPSSKKKSKPPPRLAHVEESITRHRQHVSRLEQMLRLLDNEAIGPEEVSDVRELVDDYVDRNQDDFDDFETPDDLYEVVMEHLDAMNELVPTTNHVPGAAAPSKKGAEKEKDKDKDKDKERAAAMAAKAQLAAQGALRISLDEEETKKAPASAAASKAQASPTAPIAQAGKAAQPPPPPPRDAEKAPTTPRAAAAAAAAAQAATAAQPPPPPAPPAGFPAAGRTDAQVPQPAPGGPAASRMFAGATLPPAAAANQPGRAAAPPANWSVVAGHDPTAFPSLSAGKRAPVGGAAGGRSTPQVGGQLAPPNGGGAAPAPGPIGPAAGPAAAQQLLAKQQFAQAVSGGLAGAGNPGAFMGRVAEASMQGAKDAAQPAGQPPQPPGGAAFDRGADKAVGLPTGLPDFGGADVGGAGTATISNAAQNLQLLQACASRSIPQPQDSAWASYPLRVRAPTMGLPPSYPLAKLPLLDNPALFAKLDTEALFFSFYYQPGTYQQHLAARELKNQLWRYHKQHGAWFQRHEEPKTTTDKYEQGTYVYFDYNIMHDDLQSGWCYRLKQDFTFDYDALEDELV